MIVVAFLFPLALYCFVLGVVNRRPHPLMVPAAWDFAGLLAAVSGFLIFSVPAMLSGLSESWRTFWLVGRPPGEAASDDPYNVWILVSAAYFLAVVGVSALVLRRRRSQTAVYNVETAAFEEVLLGVVESLGVVVSRTSRHFSLRLPAGQNDKDEQFAELDVDLAPSLYHATLSWDAGGEEIRSLVEGELRRTLGEVQTRDNPVGSWLLTFSTVLLLLMLAAMAAVALYRVFAR